MKTFVTSLVLGLLVLSSTAYAQPAGGAQSGNIGGSTLGAYLSSIIGFINVYLVPFLFAIAFIVFIWGVFQYFIAGGHDEEKRETGKSLMLWGIIGFFIMVSVWGLVNILRGTFNLKEDINYGQPLPTSRP